MRKVTLKKMVVITGLVAGTFTIAAPAEAATRTRVVRKAPSTNPVSIAPLPSPYPDPDKMVRPGFVSLEPNPSPGPVSIAPLPSPHPRPDWISIAPLPSP
ncbi:MAG: hypothetical protein ACT4OX_16110 [Actinomycetota bacterium]